MENPFSTFGKNLDCASCGACCREAYDAVELSPREHFRKKNPDKAIFEEGRWIVPRPSGRCVCLVGEPGSFRCERYASRPISCRYFEKGSENCWDARRRVGLDR